MSKFLKNVSKVLVIVAFFSVILMLALWLFIDALANTFNYKMVIAAVVSALLAGFLYFDQKISQLGAGSHQNIGFTSLSEAFITAKKLHNLKKIRIYAVSSYKILSLFSSSNIKVDECNVLVRGFYRSELDDESNQDFEREVVQMIKEWGLQKKKGNIKTLSLKRYNFLPTEYNVIFDDKLLIAGLYSPNKENDSKVDVEDPLLIDDSTFESQQIINKYILRFDAFERDLI